jgi:CBS domain-containing protein
MTLCPYCGYENIAGADVCDECEQPLADLYLPTPATAVERRLLKDRIRLLSPKTPIAVSPSTPVRDVLRTMVERKIGCVVVVDGGKPVGIFSERDALQKLNTDAAQLADHPISEFMTASPETLDAAAKIAFAVHRMDLGGFRHYPHRRRRRQPDRHHLGPRHSALPGRKHDHCRNGVSGGALSSNRRLDPSPAPGAFFQRPCGLK